jgi:hypothetical protein
MDDESRVTWSWIFFTLGATLALGAIIRLARWESDGGIGAHPQVLWTLGFLAAGFLVVSLQLRLPIWMRKWAAEQAEQSRREVEGNDWVDR